MSFWFVFSNVFFFFLFFWALTRNTLFYICRQYFTFDCLRVGSDQFELGLRVVIPNVALTWNVKRVLGTCMDIDSTVYLRFRNVLRWEVHFVCNQIIPTTANYFTVILILQGSYSVCESYVCVCGSKCTTMQEVWVWIVFQPKNAATRCWVISLPQGRRLPSHWAWTEPTNESRPISSVLLCQPTLA